ncbi:MAG: hypothetical protein JETCAE03_35490 [Ignavibacteriaceae bacterium]|nr:MAG: hypothetical protein JETCAE03_35490 [Ignavibacteriaceae bacterium]
MISVGKGSGSYTYNVTTGTDLIINGDLYLYGHITKTQSDTGAYSFRPYIVWKYTGGSYDSSAALRIANSFLSRVNAPILDTTGTYYASMLYKTKNGYWIYARGADSSFTTPAQIVPPDTVPVQFAFHDSTGAEYSTLVESQGVTITGIDSAWAYAGGASFKVNAGSWRTAGIKVYGSDVIYVRATSSGVCTTAVNTTLTVGGVSDVFSITTKLDNTPNQFTFTDVTGAEASTVYTTGQFTVAGIYCDASISITGGQFQIGSAAWRSSATTVANGNLVRIRQTSSANYNDSTIAILNIQGILDTFTVTTRPDTTPAQFTFTDVTNAHLDSVHTSNTITLSSLDSCYAYAGGAEYQVNSGSWVTGYTKVYNNDQIKVRQTSALTYVTTTNVTLNVGGTTDVYSVTTIPDPNVTMRFVDSRVSSSGNGQSWATAWKSFSNIVWSQLSGGGILYISGGTDSIVYNQGLDMGNVMGGTNNYVYVMPGKYSPSPSGHSGRVIITSSGNGIDISSDGSSTRWIYIKGLEIRNGGAVGIRVTYNVKNLVIDSCTIIDNYSFGIELTGWPADDSHTDTSRIIENVEIKNNVIINRADDDGVDDNIIMKYNVNTLIHHNYLRNRNQQSNITGCADPNHTDNIQASYGSPNMKIYNNICVEDSGASGQSIILGISSRYSNHYDTCLVYNNFIYNTGRVHGACDCHTHQVLYWRGSESQGQPGQYIPACFSINNTIIAANESCVGLADEYYGTIDVNNIVFEVGTNGNTPAKCASVDGTWGSPYNGGVNQRKYIDSCLTNLMYRIYASSPEIGGNTWVRSNGTVTSISNWSDWLSKGGTGVNDNPDLETNYLYDELWDRTLWNYDLAKLKSTSPAIDAGTDVSYYIDGLFGYLPDISTDDIAGNPRNGTWDIGAFEFQSP